MAREVVPGGGIVTSLTVRTRAGEWAKGMQAAEQELRRALTHGLQQEEVSREALEQKSPYLLVAANAKTRSNIEMADWLLMTLDARRVPTDPQTDLDLYTQSITGMKAADVTKAMKATFSGSGPVVFVTATKAIPGGDDAIRADLCAEPGRCRGRAAAEHDQGLQLSRLRYRRARSRNAGTSPISARPWSGSRTA